jgi:hypothetical protein
VVSSDHRIQRAARRRKARAVDSEVWYAEVLRQRSERSHRPAAPLGPPHPPVAAEVARWLERFGGEAIVEQLIEEERNAAAAPQPSKQAAPRRGRPAKEDGAPDKPATLENPFPPGYGEDLLADER